MIKPYITHRVWYGWVDRIIIEYHVRSTLSYCHTMYILVPLTAVCLHFFYLLVVKLYHQVDMMDKAIKSFRKLLYSNESQFNI